MSASHFPDLESLDVAIAKTDYSPEDKIKVRLGAVLFNDHLHEPFIEWLEAFFREHAPRRVGELGLCGKFAWVLHYQGEPCGTNKYLWFLVRVPRFRRDFEAASKQEPGIHTLDDLEQLPQPVADPEMLTFEDLLPTIQGLLPEDTHGNLCWVALCETVIEHKQYHLPFFRYTCALTECSNLEQALDQFMERQGFDDDRKRCLKSSFISYTQWLRTADPLWLYRQGDIVAMTPAWAAVNFDVVFESPNTLQILVLSPRGQAWLVEAVDAALPVPAPFKVKLESFLLARMENSLSSLHYRFEDEAFGNVPPRSTNAVMDDAAFFIRNSAIASLRHHLDQAHAHYWQTLDNNEA